MKNNEDITLYGELITNGVIQTIKLVRELMDELEDEINEHDITNQGE